VRADRSYPADHLARSFFRNKPPATLSRMPRNSRPNILYLVHRVPYPPNRGDRIRSYHLLRFLAQRANVHLAALSDEPLEPDTLDTLDGLCAKVAIVPLGRRSRWLGAAINVTRGRTITEGLFRSRELKRVVRNWAGAIDFDAALVFCSSMMQYTNVPELTDVPVVVDLVDVDSQKWFDYAETARTPKKQLFAMEGRRIRRLERVLASRARGVALVSQAEGELFRAICPTAPIYPIPNGVDLDYFNPTLNLAETTPLRCAFVGALDYRANVDGLLWFCANVWPQVHRQLPEATLALIGRNPVAAVQKLADLPGVDLIGQVPDIRPHLAAATLTVVPLRVARGIQNKVLEAMAMGKPVVASPQSLEGLTLTPDIHVRRAETPAQWVTAITALLQSPDEVTRFSTAGREFTEQHHDWDTLMSGFGRLLALPNPTRAVAPTPTEPSCTPCEP